MNLHFKSSVFTDSPLTVSSPCLLCFQGRTHIFKIHARSMSVERDIRFELLARLCPNSTGTTDSTLTLNHCEVSAVGDAVFDLSLCRQGRRFAACAQKPACSPSELAGRSPPRRTSWKRSTRSSSPTPSSAPPQDTWPTTESKCVRERECVVVSVVYPGTKQKWPLFLSNVHLK